MSQRGIRWLFNPPAASLMGGVWKRQIRSVRRVLSTIMTEQVPTSEMLTTLLVIAEGIINNKLLTPVSDDPNDLEPLTPNHLLIHDQLVFRSEYCSTKTTCIVGGSGVKSNTWQMSSGDDGPRSIS